MRTALLALALLSPLAAHAEKGGQNPTYTIDITDPQTCAACHSVDGSTIVGPSLKGFWGRATVLADATVVRGDAEYFASSIKNPTAQVVKGFPPAMPTLGLSDEEIEAVMHYVITLK